MKVEGPGASAGVNRRRKTERAPDGAALEFERALRGALGGGAEDAAGEVGGAEGGGAVSGLTGLLAVQEVGAVDDATSGRRKRDRLVRHGEDMLDHLEEIRLGLLLGAIPKARLMDLARTVRAKREQGTDRQLDALLDEIELRAEVELAKLAHART